MSVEHPVMTFKLARFPSEQKCEAAGLYITPAGEDPKDVVTESPLAFVDALNTPNQDVPRVLPLTWRLALPPRPTAVSRFPPRPSHLLVTFVQLPATSCSPGAVIDATSRGPQSFHEFGVAHTPSHGLLRAPTNLALPPQFIAASCCSLRPLAPFCHPRVAACSLSPSGDLSTTPAISRYFPWSAP
ncbi:hypothetical protein EDB19DRAFT_1914934 [Suillus lakei]|nr:hypothetical protein EDB19DRAFT_1914934 [Suillus lakei]